MRIRILSPLTGVLAGHSLSQFIPGDTYDVPEAFGLQLIAMRAAVEVRATDPLSEPSEDIDMARLTGGIHVLHVDKAADHPDRRRRKRR